MIILAADHGGFELKEKLKKYLIKQGQDIVDIGAFEEQPLDDFTKYAKLAMARMKENKKAKSIVVCGSGVGVAIVCNRYPGIYAAVGINEEQVKLSRQHNHINVLNLAGRTTTFAKAKKMVDIFLSEPALGGKYAKRMKEIDE